MQDNIKSPNYDVKLEKMRYQSNSLSYMYGMLGLLCSIVAMFVALNSVQSQKNPAIIVMILGDIVILLFGFLSCERVKNYDKKFAYVMFGLGGVCIVRIFWVPLQLIVYGTKWINRNADPTKTTDIEAECNKYLGSVITKGTGYLPDSGIFRG